MNFDDWFWTILIAIGLVIAYAIGTHSNETGKCGSSMPHTALDVNTGETTEQVIIRASKTIGIAILILGGGYLYEQFVVHGNRSFQQFIVLLGLTMIVPYIAGISEAYSQAKSREQNGITHLQELGAAPSLYRRSNRIIYRKGTKQIDLNYPFSSYISLSVEDSHAFFKDIQDGDLLFVFDTALEKYQPSQMVTVVAYRETTATVLKVGQVSYKAKLEERRPLLG